MEQSKLSIWDHWFLNKPKQRNGSFNVFMVCVLKNSSQLVPRVCLLTPCECCECVVQTLLINSEKSVGIVRGSIPDEFSDWNQREPAYDYIDMIGGSVTVNLAE
jgi:hypothetical protein